MTSSSPVNPNEPSPTKNVRGAQDKPSSEPPQKQRDRRGSTKTARQEYLECLDALSETNISDNRSPRRKVPPRRCVSFSSASTYTVVSLTGEEFADIKHKIWYTEEDEGRFKEAARMEVAAFKRLQKGGDSAAKQKDMCIVGLEQHLVSHDYTKKRARTKKLISYAVLGAQARGGDAGDPERIAKTARRYSEWSAEQAKKFGDFQHIQSK